MTDHTPGGFRLSRRGLLAVAAIVVGAVALALVLTGNVDQLDALLGLARDLAPGAEQ